MKKDKHHFIRIKYPKILFFLLTIVLAYFIFKGRDFPIFSSILSQLGYLGTFLSGMLYTSGFTSAPATSLFLILGKQQNIYLASLIGGLGSMIVDILIFQTIRLSFKDEIEKLEKEKIVKLFFHNIPFVIKKNLAPVIGFIIISSPLPDELGISLLALNKKISVKQFSTIAYIASILGIFILLSIGRVV